MQPIGAFGAAGTVSGCAAELTFACHNNLLVNSIGHLQTLAVPFGLCQMTQLCPFWQKTSKTKVLKVPYILSDMQP
jgi:hypothetical protein